MSKNYKDVFNFFMLEKVQLTKNGLPIVHGTDYIPTQLIPFNYAKITTNKNVGIHFYIDDYQFERIWNKPITYTKLLKNLEIYIKENL